MTEEQIKHMVQRFLGWRLPKPWNPDNGISYKRPNYAHAEAEHDWPIGTNLFDATQAEAMVRHMLDGLPSTDSMNLDKWISDNFAGHGAAVRREGDPAIPGEPLMSMADAKELTRRAVERFGNGINP